MTTEEKRKLHGMWLIDIRSQARNLNAWEQLFLDSIEERLDEDWSLSEQQAEVLERIYAEKTS